MRGNRRAVSILFSRRIVNKKQEAEIREALRKNKAPKGKRLRVELLAETELEALKGKVRKYENWGYLQIGKPYRAPISEGSNYYHWIQEVATLDEPYSDGAYNT